MLQKFKDWWKEIFWMKCSKCKKPMIKEEMGMSTDSGRVYYCKKCTDEYFETENNEK